MPMVKHLIFQMVAQVLNGRHAKGIFYELKILAFLSFLFFIFSDSRTLKDCVALKAPTFEWESDDCMGVKDFICEQTRCYYYNYGSIPVSPAQG